MSAISHNKLGATVYRVFILLLTLSACYGQHGPEPLSDEWRRENQRKQDNVIRDGKIKRSLRESEAAAQSAIEAQAAADEAKARLQKIETILNAKNEERPPRLPNANNYKMSPEAMEMVRRMQEADTLAEDRANLARAQQRADAQMQAIAAERAQLEAEKQAQREAEYEREVNLSRDRVYSAYPIFAKVDSIERLALDAYVNQALADSARREEFKNTNWPARLAVEFANKYGIKVGASKSISER